MYQSSQIGCFYNHISVIRISWFGFFVKWHINLCKLFNAKAILLEEQ